MISGSLVSFDLDYEGTKNLADGDIVSSDVISAGGHLWKIDCYPHGLKWSAEKGIYVSLFLRLISSNRAKAIFEAFVLTRDGTPCTIAAQRADVYEFQCTSGEDCWGWRDFVKRVDLERNYVTGSGLVTFVCGIAVMSGGGDDVLVVPPPDIGEHLGQLLDGAEGADVSFVVGGETFPAHRAVLAARSPVFRAELFGQMSEATSPCITLQDIEPATFRDLLRFIYTDDLPRDTTGELDSSPSSTDTFKNLLAMADRYALDRLKLLCAQKLVEGMTADTVADILACAETYSCPELKNKCIDFLAVENNFKNAVFTEGFAVLVQEFPLVAAEVKKRVLPN